MANKKPKMKIEPTKGRPTIGEAIAVYSVRGKKGTIEKFKYYLEKRYDTNFNSEMNKVIEAFVAAEDRKKDEHTAGANAVYEKAKKL